MRIMYDPQRYANDYAGYKALGKKYKHKAGRHSVFEYVKGKLVIAT